MNVQPHTVKAFGEELNQLSSDVARMGGLAEALVADCIQAVVRRDGDLAASIIDRDKQVDVMEREIEKRVIRIIALRQPMATDLRATIAAYRISHDLERIGDLAKNIARRTHVLNESEPVVLTRGVERMGKLVVGHLHDTLNAYSSGAVDEAVTAWRADEEVDEHYNSLFRELLTYMMEDPRMISSSTQMLFVAKNLERIGDHCTNIAEMVHYLVTGEELHRAPPVPKSDLSDPA
ncbi:phosphate signaling complex protein PhoU [Hyphobacterium sp. Y6023]|uniref:Phosphate-specific transport system accessory protein PhoU n=1 Tax=Hyphobacterium marinum TaxID=3116574 RepID=A0ABU7LWC7_9PROT|nr:phosphate signaling complex protein PhoU [Hyphobacterium sp. Y6023]MEE2565863.1 phosphate signaling complex protein PhoU [Hyphobacterium sp. Y6023]